MLEYKGFHAQIEFNSSIESLEHLAHLHGRVTNCADIITFEAKGMDEFKRVFKYTIDTYLSWVYGEEWEPSNRKDGVLQLHMSDRLHRKLLLEAEEEGVTLNHYIVGRLKDEALEAEPA